MPSKCRAMKRYNRAVTHEGATCHDTRTLLYDAGNRQVPVICFGTFRRRRRVHGICIRAISHYHLPDDSAFHEHYSAGTKSSLSTQPFDTSPAELVNSTYMKSPSSA